MDCPWVMIERSTVCYAVWLLMCIKAALPVECRKTERGLFLISGWVFEYRTCQHFRYGINLLQMYWFRYFFLNSCIYVIRWMTCAFQPTWRRISAAWCHGSLVQTVASKKAWWATALNWELQCSSVCSSLCCHWLSATFWAKITNSHHSCRIRKVVCVCGGGRSGTLFMLQRRPEECLITRCMNE